MSYSVYFAKISAQSLRYIYSIKKVNQVIDRQREGEKVRQFTVGLMQDLILLVLGSNSVMTSTRRGSRLNFSATLPHRPAT